MQLMCVSAFHSTVKGFPDKFTLELVDFLDLLLEYMYKSSAVF